MRYFKKTFIWIIVLVAIGGYTMLDFKSTKIAEQKKEEESRLLPFTADQVLALTIKKESGTIELERWEKGWKIVSPINAMAKNETVEKFIHEVTESRNDSDYVMDPNPTPERLTEFGLVVPSITLTLKVGKELKEHTLLFGIRAPMMGVAYAQLQGQKQVYRVNADCRAEADKDAYYFRDKSVLKLNPVMVDQVAVNWEGQPMLFKLSEAGIWKVEKPINARADQKKLLEFMGTFANTEIKEFISEKKEKLAAYGLDKPSAVIKFWLSGDSSPSVQIDIGKRSPEKRGYYCAMSDRDAVFILEEKAVNSVPRVADEMRSKQLFFYESEKIKRIEVRSAAKSVALVKGADKEWRKGGPKGEVADFSIVNDFIEEMKNFETREFVSNDLRDMRQYGLDPAVIQVQMWLEDSAAPITLNLGKSTPAGYVYAFATAEKSVLTVEEKTKRVLETFLRDL